MSSTDSTVRRVVSSSSMSADTSGCTITKVTGSRAGALPRGGGGGTVAIPLRRTLPRDLRVGSEAFPDVEEDVRQSLRRIEVSPFVTATTSLRGFVFDVSTGRLTEV